MGSASTPRVPSFTAWVPVSLPLVSLSDPQLHLSYSPGPTDFELDVGSNQLTFSNSFSQPESNVTEDRDRKSGFCHPYYKAHSRHLVFADFIRLLY